MKARLAQVALITFAMLSAVLGTLLYMQGKPSAKPAREPKPPAAAEAQPAAQPPPKGPRVVAPVSKEEQAKVEETQSEIVRLGAILQGEIKLWEKKNPTLKELRALGEERKAWAEATAKQHKLKAGCYVALLDEAGRQKCGGDLWGVQDGAIVVAR